MNRKSVTRDLGEWIIVGSILGTLVYVFTKEVLCLAIGPALGVVLGSIICIAKR